MRSAKRQMSLFVGGLRGFISIYDDVENILQYLRCVMANMSYESMNVSVSEGEPRKTRLILNGLKVQLIQKLLCLLFKVLNVILL